MGEPERDKKAPYVETSGMELHFHAQATVRLRPRIYRRTPFLQMEAG